MTADKDERKEQRTANKGLAKLVVQWLNETLYPAVYMRDVVVADSLVLRIEYHEHLKKIID